MSLEEFKWDVEASPSGNITINTRSVKFGDGYQQRSGEGLNDPSEEWSISVTDKIEVILEIRNFFNSHGGWKSFVWRNPMDELGLYYCEKYSINPISPSISKLTATFNQSFTPQ